MPPVFGLPPAIQKISLNDDSARAAASALVPLESLMNSTSAVAADLLHAMRKARKTAQALSADTSRADAERQRRQMRAGRILRVVQPAQRADAVDLSNLACARRRQHERSVSYRDRRHRPSGPCTETG